MKLFRKGTKAYSILKMKCPKCHEGDLFPTSTFSFQKPFDMHTHCPNCNENYAPEPGFYYGAMFISYIITGWFCLAFVGLLILGFGWSINSSFIALIFVITALFVWIFRISRSLWINIVVKYDPNIEQKLSK